jgi:hypothetical protein
VDPARIRATSEAVCPCPTRRRDDDDGPRVRYDAGAALVGFNYTIVDYGVDPETDNSRTSALRATTPWRNGLLVGSSHTTGPRPDSCLQVIL